MEQKKMTMQEAEKKIDTYKEIFSVVRLLKGEEIEETQKQKTDVPEQFFKNAIFLQIGLAIGQDIVYNHPCTKMQTDCNLLK